MSQERLGHYRILEKIATGAQGSVYRAFDPDTGLLVALKILHRSSDLGQIVADSLGVGYPEQNEIGSGDPVLNPCAGKFVGYPESFIVDFG